MSKLEKPITNVDSELEELELVKNHTYEEKPDRYGKG